MLFNPGACSRVPPGIVERSKQGLTGLEWCKHKEERQMKRLAAMIALMLTTLTIASCGGKQTAAEPATEAATSTAGEAAAETANEAEAADEAATDDEVQAPALALPDGYYTADFKTDGSMFHVNEAKDGKGILTVKDGEMTIHIVMPSKNVVNLFRGSAEDAQKDGAELIQPKVEEVTYSDGTTEEVNSFDVSVPYLNQTFDLALVGTKGKWYDHKVSVSNAVPMDAAQASAAATGAEAAAEEETADDAAGSEVSEEDQKAADEVAALIDAIYVQEWTEETDQMCADAKAAWDALTDAQKALVEGESADPDYFGRDTGDASKDDPRNGDEIGEKELLVVSFGTSFNDSRAEDIGGIESALQEAYPDWAVRRAFTAQIIINHVLARDGEKIDNVEQALERAAANGVKELVIQPTHLMHGAEYDELTQAVDNFRDMFESVEIAEPLLGEVGADASVVNADKETVAKAVVQTAVEAAGYDSIEAAAEDGTAFVFMGHGTSHAAKVTYSQMQTQMEDLGFNNVFIGTVEGEPEETSCEAVIEKVREAGYTKVVLRPLMVVAGDHANNDMAGEDEDSWVSQFEATGAFEKVDTQIAGLGSIPAVQEIYVQHTGEVMK